MSGATSATETGMRLRCERQSEMGEDEMDREVEEIEDVGEDIEALAMSQYGIPPALAKAMYDQSFDYALGLCTGEVIRLGTAHISADGKWVHLSDMGGYGDETYTVSTSASFPFVRGVDVRLDDIVWVAEAPGKLRRVSGYSRKEGVR